MSESKVDVIISARLFVKLENRARAEGFSSVGELISFLISNKVGSIS